MLNIFLYVFFTVISIVLGGIVLLQEGKGGGMGAAFGGVGGEAFGHGAGGINRFTSVLAALFLVIAIVIALVTKPGSIA
ncbi:MAG: preprotein translocase subunit SecG [Planctomycetes bacterium]|nr:preprotein translocase subunit SecG [Planctomycetota bacterium]